MRAVERDFMCDGELVVLDEQGRPQWERLKRRHALRHPGGIRHAAAEEPACIFAFDLLWLNGEDYRARTLLDRKWARSAWSAGQSEARRALRGPFSGAVADGSALGAGGNRREGCECGLHSGAVNALGENQNSGRSRARAGALAVTS